MIRWIIFAIVALGWIAICWFFGSMVALTDSAPYGSMARQQCAQQMVRERIPGDYWQHYNSSACAAAGRKVTDARAAPAKRNGLLIGVLPVLFVGGVMVLRRRRSHRPR